MKPCDHTSLVDGCRICFLYDTDPAYRHLWGGEPLPAPASPGLLAKIANFAGAALAHVAAGMPQTSPDELARRLALCMACEHLRGESCGLCGCNCQRKAAWDEQRCPIGKW